MSHSLDSSGLDWALVGRYLGGELSPAERAAFERWVEADPRRRDELMLVRRLWDDAGAAPSAERVDAMWRALSDRMRARPSPGPVILPKGETPARAHRRRIPALPAITTHGRWTTSIVVAAAAMMMVGLVAADRHYRSRPATAVIPPVKEFRTEPGQRATIQLSDGSRVDLGVASVIRVAPFTDSSRTVTLEGEALFDVVHDARRPFRVLSAGTVTEDLGTRFGVRAYREDASVRVVVTSGIVSVRSLASSTAPSILGAGQLARLDPRGTVRVESNVDTARYLAWTNSRVILRNQTLRDAATEIARWHDVRITIPDARVARMRITVDMRLGSLEETLNAVTIPLALRYRVSDGGAVITR